MNVIEFKIFSDDEIWRDLFVRYGNDTKLTKYEKDQVETLGCKRLLRNRILNIKNDSEKGSSRIYDMSPKPNLMFDTISIARSQKIKRSRKLSLTSDKPPSVRESFWDSFGMTEKYSAKSSERQEKIFSEIINRKSTKREDKIQSTTRAPTESELSSMKTQIEKLNLQLSGNSSIDDVVKSYQEIGAKLKEKLNSLKPLNSMTSESTEVSENLETNQTSSQLISLKTEEDDDDGSWNFKKKVKSKKKVKKSSSAAKKNKTTKKS